MNHQLKRYLASALLIGSAFSLNAALAAPPQDLKGTNIVLVHGAFADGSSWDKVIPLLEARGLHVVAVQNPLSSLADDTAATQRAIDQQTGPVVLVGHSWGGAVITQAGNDDKVKALVYVAALVPDSGESVNDLFKGKPATPGAGEFKKDSANFLKLSTKGVVNDFAQDLPPAQARILAATQGPWFAGALDDKVGTAAWHTKPSWYLVANQDRMIDPHAEEAMAKQIGATTTHVNSSHVPMLSQPKAVADAIIAAASKVH
ncbi:alpha/beta fold hydrolase [Paraburkholderia sp. BR13439]|uniref:alpha/beta fold hydrolase n=1 Tax=Paraburkholderia sp. BR13439 TaxID=3236996 RepID=UPI0034D0123A